MAENSKRLADESNQIGNVFAIALRWPHRSVTVTTFNIAIAALAAAAMVFILTYWITLALTG